MALNHTLLITHKGKNTEHTHSEQVQADSGWDAAQFENAVQFWVLLFLTSHGAHTGSPAADESPFSPPSVTAAQTALSHVSSSVHYSHPFLALKP